jgi:1-pyrroline-5-carboxylate dehydrogenase
MPKKAAPKVTYVSMSADESLHPKFEAELKRFEARLGSRYPMYIGGRKVWSGAGEFEVRSPIDTSIVIGRFQRGTREHASEAISAAKEGFERWSARPWPERVKAMQRFAALVDQRKFEIAVAITYEVGKTRMEALAEAWEAVDSVNYCAKLMRERDGFVTKMGPGGPGENTIVACKPYGVWPIISPFNFPFMLASGMAIGALITGNSVILKPTSAAPLSGLMLYQAFSDAGVPAGAVNFVTGPGANFEDEFVSNADVAGLAFTGSKDVGMRLYRRFHTTQPYPKPMLLEMGSKNPTIVTSKADIAKAVEGTVRAAYGYSGQKCSATSRLYLQKGIADEFLDALQARVGKMVVGDPRKREVFTGPVINGEAVEKFDAVIKEAKAAGGKVVIGGKAVRAGPLSKGFYLAPTVITGLPRGHRLFRDELFLPVVVVAEFSAVDEAVAAANDTEYGLTAGIFSKDKAEIGKFFDGIRFGVTYANRAGGSTTGAWPGAQSFTGWNASGATGRGVGGPNYLLNFVRDQSQTTVS